MSGIPKRIVDAIDAFDEAAQQYSYSSDRSSLKEAQDDFEKLCAARRALEAAIEECCASKPLTNSAE